MPQVLSQTRIAAGNNADLCAAIMGAQGLRFERDRSTFRCLDAPPPYYPQMVTLEPNLSTQHILRMRDSLETRPRISPIKDSFADLDYAALGMAVLFEASWIWRDGGHEKAPDGWRRIRDPAELAAWQNAWRAAGSPTDQVIFPPPPFSTIPISSSSHGGLARPSTPVASQTCRTR